MNGLHVSPRLAISVLAAALLLSFPAAARADEPDDTQIGPPAPSGPMLVPPVTIPVVPMSPIAPIARVRIDSTIPVRLEQRAVRAGRASAWSTACDAPCDRNLPLGDEYRVLYGKDVTAGPPFRLRAEAGSKVTLTVRPASKAGEAGGVALVVVGAALGMASLAGVVVFGSIATRTPSEEACFDGNTRGRDGGIMCGFGEGVAKVLVVFSAAGMLLGGGIVAGGVALMNSSGPALTQKPAPPLAAFVREPTWVGPRGMPPGPSGKRPFVVPLSFSF
jgi:hypothetical protein